jgi:hypothetical protein
MAYYPLQREKDALIAFTLQPPAYIFVVVFSLVQKRLFASSSLSVRPSVRMYQLGFYWTDFHQILY